MSHFNVLVLTKDGTEEQAEALLAPFDEGRQVPKYNRPCWCLGIKARQRIFNRLTQETPLNKARTDFVQRPDVQKLIEASKAEGNYGFSKEIDLLWEESFLKPFEARQVELILQEPDATHANPDCLDCGGTGSMVSTYNPISKWDAYELGGAWSEIFQSVQGVTASEFLVLAKGMSFAILTPDGEWVEKGVVLNHGFVKDAMSDEEWQIKYLEVLNKFCDYRVLVYDCHI